MLERGLLAVAIPSMLVTSVHAQTFQSGTVVAATTFPSASLTPPLAPATQATVPAPSASQPGSNGQPPPIPVAPNPIAKNLISGEQLGCPGETDLANNPSSHSVRYLPGHCGSTGSAGRARGPVMRPILPCRHVRDAQCRPRQSNVTHTSADDR